MMSEDGETGSAEAPPDPAVAAGSELTVLAQTPSPGTATEDELPPGILWRFATFATLLFLLVGSILYPWWWYEFIFKGKVFAVNHWGAGLSYIAKHYSLPALVIAILFVWMALAVPRARRLATVKLALRNALYPLRGATGAIFLAVL